MNHKSLEFKSEIFKGNESLKNKNFKDAKIYFEKAANIMSNVPDVYNTLGNINLNLNEIDTAITNFKKAISLKKNYSPAYCNLGTAFTKIKKDAQALESFIKAIEIDPKNFIAHFNLANLYKSQDKIDQAEKSYLLAIEIKPDLIVLYNNLFDLYDRSNQYLKLNETINKAIEVFKKHPVIDFFIGVVEFKKKNYLQAINIFENINLDKNDYKRVAFKDNMLAKSYDHLGKYEKAYNYFEKSNLVTQSSNKNIDKNIYLNIVKKRFDYFSKINQKKLNDFKKNDDFEDPIFLVGFPRSGTTLLDTILRTHGSIEMLEEKPIVEKFIYELMLKIKGNFFELDNINQNNFDKFRKKYFDLRKNFITSNESKIYIDKLPLNIIHIGEIIKFFPNSKFILALRNPYDVVLSCFMQSFLPNPAMANFFNLSDTIYLYDLVMSLWEKYNDIFKLNVFTIKYEDTVLRFEDTIRDLLNFLNLDWSDNLKEFYKTAEKRGIINTPSYDQVSKPLYNQSINRWHNYQNKVVDQKFILDKWVRKFNYQTII